jgi:hypothetical protein
LKGYARYDPHGVRPDGLKLRPRCVSQVHVATHLLEDEGHAEGGVQQGEAAGLHVPHQQRYRLPKELAALLAPGPGRRVEVVLCLQIHLGLPPLRRRRHLFQCRHTA